MIDSLPLALSGTEMDAGEPIEELCDAAAALDVRMLELWYPRNTSHAGTVATFRTVQSFGLSVACVASGSELYRNGGSIPDQALLLEAIELAAAWNAPLVNTYFGYAAVRDDDAAIDMYKRLLAPCLERAREHSITIVLENEFDAFGMDPCASDITRRPASLGRLLEEVGDPAFRLNFDAANFVCAGVRPAAAFARLHRHVGYCHVKDASPADEPSALVADWRTYQDYGRRYQTRPLGEGVVEWSALLPTLLTASYRGVLTLEPHAEPPLRRRAWEQAVMFVRSLAQKIDRHQAPETRC